MALLVLEGFQRRFLRAQAHTLHPIVQIGESGITDATLAALDEALTHHELVKVRLTRPPDKRATALELAERSGAALCGLVGHTVILYRPHPERPRITLPRREPAARNA